MLSPVVQQHANKPIKVSHLLVSAPTSSSESDHQSIPPMQKWLPGSLSCLPSLDQAVEDDDVIVTIRMHVPHTNKVLVGCSVVIKKLVKSVETRTFGTMVQDLNTLVP